MHSASLWQELGINKNSLHADQTRYLGCQLRLMAMTLLIVKSLLLITHSLITIKFPQAPVQGTPFRSLHKTMGSVTIPGMDTVTVTGKSVVYKTTHSGLDILFDVWPPSSASSEFCGSAAEPIVSPTFIYFHGGGLAAGNRYNFTPRWLFGALNFYTAMVQELQLICYLNSLPIRI